MFQISAFALRGEVGKQLRDDRHIANLVAAQVEAARDFFEGGPAEHSQAVVEAVGAQLVKLRAVAAVVPSAYDRPLPTAPNSRTVV